MTYTREQQLWWRHLISVLVAPVTVTLVIPALIVAATGERGPDLNSPAGIGLVTVGGLLIAGGLGLLVWTVVLFDRWGEGTLGVGELLGEPVHLVVHGPYRHMRNPMISAVLCILLGEAAVMASGWLLGWVAIFLALRLTVIRFWEEPHLVRRYGNEYVEYRRHVPRWFPRISARR
ncbi:methyltransferase family protein [Mycobacterium lacus]|nr:isoprenylcysteine carboxylmethyltransferase family protein [Mycobacterium lacus]